MQKYGNISLKLALRYGIFDIVYNKDEHCTNIKWFLFDFCDKYYGYFPTKQVKEMNLHNCG